MTRRGGVTPGGVLVTPGGILVTRTSSWGDEASWGHPTPPGVTPGGVRSPHPSWGHPTPPGVTRLSWGDRGLLGSRGGIFVTRRDPRHEDPSSSRGGILVTEEGWGHEEGSSSRGGILVTRRGNAT